MNILLIGGGGREHALAYAIAASPLVERLYCAPGNPGTAEYGENVALDIADHAAVAQFCHSSRIGLVVVGPEAPLVAGIVDDLTAAGIKAFGPTRGAARLEGSKGFTKDLCATAGIPTAAYRRFRDAEAALGHVAANGAPLVVKLDGLAQGKGVTVAETTAEAVEAVRQAFAGRSDDAGTEIVIEERLHGPELSFFALCDGRHAVPLSTAEDYKRVGDGDTGPNTGGMGAFSPGRLIDPALEARVLEADHPADPDGARRPRHALSRRPLCRADAHRRGTEAHRIQRPVRRSRVPGPDDAVKGRYRHPDAGGGRRRPRHHVGALP